MKKNLKLIASVLFIVLFIGAIVYFGGKSNKNENLSQPSSDLVVADSYETKTLPVDDIYTKFDVQYPSFKNTPVEFNLEIENLLKAQIEDFQKSSAENWQARYDTQSPGENIPKVPIDKDKFTFSSDFTIVQSNDSYISFVMHYGGFNGGAHGFENVVSYNYDIKNKKVIELRDLFSKDFDYLNYLSKESRIYLKNQFAQVSEEDKKNSEPEALKEYEDNMISMIEAGTEPKLENFSTFTFTDSAVKIYFADYQVGPHSIGMPEFEVNRG
jgi:hypothetical protein